MFGWFKKEDPPPQFVYSVEATGKCHCGSEEFSIVGFQDTVSCLECGAMFFIGDRIKSPVVKLKRAMLVKQSTKE